jgi:murein DD-endopeptidase MepM/ murein hydrolase activator NlpD
VTAIAGAAFAPPTLLRSDAPERGDAAEAARQLEAFFVRQFLAQAKPQTPGMLDGGFAGDTFREMLDGAMADAIAEAGGLGLASTFEAALGGEPATRPTRTGGGLTLLDQLDGERAAGGLAQPTPGRVSSGFGPRPDPMGDGHGFHSGLDIAAATGTPVVAAAAGQVVAAGPAGSYGNLIAIRHPDGTETRYAHLSAIDVKVGDPIAAGAPIGAVGSTGRSTGPHLHFEVRQGGRAVDPRPYLESDASPLHRRD